MSATYRLQVAVWYDSLSPKDGMVIDPTFHVTGAGDGDPQQLCDDLAAAVDTKIPATTQVRVRAYKLPYVKGAGHVGEKELQTGASPASSMPRELALCLSYYAGQNRPRYRGRLYIPLQFLGLAITGNRPSSQQMTEVMSWRSVFENLGGVDVDWCLYSERDNVARAITNVWCDDEFDIIRTRGLRGTTRQTATTGEAGAPNLVLLQAPAPAPADSSPNGTRSAA